MITKRILWAIDTHEKHPKAVNASVEFLQTLNKTISCEVDAVTVIYGEKTDGIEAKEQFRERLKFLLGETIKKEWFGKEVILIDKQIPQRAAVLKLLNYAHRQDYDALLIVKHSRKKENISYLGSFAEMTAFLSELPLFLINPDGFIPEKMEKILIPIGETAENAKDFKALFRFLPLEGMKAKLFHRIAIPFYFQSKEYISQFLLDQKNLMLKNIRIIELMAKHSAGKVEIDIKKRTQSIDEAILDTGRKGKFDLIEIMHKRKGSLGFILGKTTKKILQNADRPVLLFRP